MKIKYSGKAVYLGPTSFPKKQSTKIPHLVYKDKSYYVKIYTNNSYEYVRVYNLNKKYVGEFEYIAGTTTNHWRLGWRNF